MSKSNEILGRPAVFGDQEQIDAIKTAERKLAEVLDEGYQIFGEFTEVNLDVTIGFKCVVCNEQLSISHGTTIGGCETLEDILDDTTGRGRNCPSCKSSYKIDYGKDRKYPTIYLMYNSKRPEQITKIKKDE